MMSAPGGEILKVTSLSMSAEDRPSVRTQGKKKIEVKLKQSQNT